MTKEPTTDEKTEKTKRARPDTEFRSVGESSATFRGGARAGATLAPKKND